MWEYEVYQANFLNPLLLEIKSSWVPNIFFGYSLCILSNSDIYSNADFILGYRFVKTGIHIIEKTEWGKNIRGKCLSGTTEVWICNYSTIVCIH